MDDPPSKDKGRIEHKSRPPLARSMYLPSSRKKPFCAEMDGLRDERKESGGRERKKEREGERKKERRGEKRVGGQREVVQQKAKEERVGGGRIKIV